MRLSALGVNQAVQTGDWLREEFPEGFDAYYSSPHTRTIETAGRMALKGEWNLDDRLRERDWGEFGLLNDEQRQTQYAISLRLMGQNKWYWCPAGGESLATGVRLRYRDMLDTWHREQAGKKLLAIVHGEVIDVAMFEHERLIPSDWLQRDKDPNYKVSNCQILHYSRTNPKTGELTEKLQWRRAICAWDESRSWNEGQWVKLERKRYEDTELLNMAANHPPLLRDEDSVK